MDYIIRRGQIEDARAIAHVHVQSWRETYVGLIPQNVLDGLSIDDREQMWCRALQSGRSGMYCATADAQISGFISVGQSRDRTTYSEVYALYLLRRYQGRGIGKALFETAKQHARESGTQALRLWVLDSNPTRGFYESMGGKIGAEKTENMEGAQLREVEYLFEL